MRKLFKGKLIEICSPDTNRYKKMDFSKIASGNEVKILSFKKENPFLFVSYYRAKKK